MNIYYNDFDKGCCEVLDRHIMTGDLPPGVVDLRSIIDVEARDVGRYRQAHLFAGIGAIPLGFRRAGIPDDFSAYTGGFPCQDVSVAGRREGLGGERSGLWFEFHRIVAENRPEWVVIENVPGLLSSNGGRDFAIVLGGLTGIIPEVPGGGWGNAGVSKGPVYSVAYRILDAQFFGVPQRRRRVFVVANLAAGCAQEVLFERESSPWDTPPSRETWPKVADTVGTSANRVSGRQGGLVPLAFGGGNQEAVGVATSSNAYGQRYDFESETFICHENKQGDLTSADHARALRNGVSHNYQFICNTFNGYTGGSDDNDAQGNHIVWDARNITEIGDVTHPLQAKKTGGYSLNYNPLIGVRRLTPVECERLQGFPDGWTEGQSDSARYRQLGNAVAVPVAHWLGKRILSVAKGNGGLGEKAGGCPI